MASIHALLILSMPVVTLALFVFGKLQFPRGIRRIAITTAAVAVLMLVIGNGTAAATPWYPGGPLFVGMGCVFVTLLFVRGPAWRYAGAAGLAISTIALIMHAWSITDFSHRKQFCRLYREPYNYNTMALRELNSVGDLLQEAAGKGNGNRYPEGWVEEAVPLPYVGDAAQGLARLPRPIRAWHSGLTGIADTDPANGYGIWFAGGTLEDVRSRLVIKSRPLNNSLAR